MTIQRNSNHILDLNRILKRKPHKFDGEEGSSRIFTGTSDGPSNEVLTTNNNNSLSTLAPIKSDNVNYNPNDGYKTYKVDPDGTEKSNFKEPEGKGKLTGSQVGGAISGVASGLTGMYAAFKGNSSIADTSGYKKQANSIANSSSSAETNDALLNDMNSFNPMNSVSYGQVRGVSNGEMATNTINSIGSGASAGASFGPWGAAIGAVVGLGTGVAGIFSGNSKARREKARLNGQIAAANQSAINNFANTASNINTNTNINLGRNYFAQGGHLFKNGNNVYTGTPEMLSADYAKNNNSTAEQHKFIQDWTGVAYKPKAKPKPIPKINLRPTDLSSNAPSSTTQANAAANVPILKVAPEKAAIIRQNIQDYKDFAKLPYAANVYGITPEGFTRYKKDQQVKMAAAEKSNSESVGSTHQIIQGVPDMVTKTLGGDMARKYLNSDPYTRKKILDQAEDQVLAYDEGNMTNEQLYQLDPALLNRANADKAMLGSLIFAGTPGSGDLVTGAGKMVWNKVLPWTMAGRPINTAAKFLLSKVPKPIKPLLYDAEGNLMKGVGDNLFKKAGRGLYNIADKAVNNNWGALSENAINTAELAGTVKHEIETSPTIQKHWGEFKNAANNYLQSNGVDVNHGVNGFVNSAEEYLRNNGFRDNTPEGQQKRKDVAAAEMKLALSGTAKETVNKAGLDTLMMIAPVGFSKLLSSAGKLKLFKDKLQNIYKDYEFYKSAELKNDDIVHEITSIGSQPNLTSKLNKSLYDGEVELIESFFKDQKVFTPEEIERLKSGNTIEVVSDILGFDLFKNRAELLAKRNPIITYKSDSDNINEDDPMIKDIFNHVQNNLPAIKNEIIKRIGLSNNVSKEFDPKTEIIKLDFSFPKTESTTGEVVTVNIPISSDHVIPPDDELTREIATQLAESMYQGGVYSRVPITLSNNIDLRSSWDNAKQANESQNQNGGFNLPNRTGAGNNTLGYNILDHLNDPTEVKDVSYDQGSLLNSKIGFLDNDSQPHDFINYDFGKDNDNGFAYQSYAGFGNDSFTITDKYSVYRHKEFEPIRQKLSDRMDHMLLPALQSKPGMVGADGVPIKAGSPLAVVTGSCVTASKGINLKIPHDTEVITTPNRAPLTARALGLDLNKYDGKNGVNGYVFDVLPEQFNVPGKGGIDFNTIEQSSVTGAAIGVEAEELFAVQHPLEYYQWKKDVAIGITNKVNTTNPGEYYPHDNIKDDYSIYYSRDKNGNPIYVTPDQLLDEYNAFQNSVDENGLSRAGLKETVDLFDQKAITPNDAVGDPEKAYKKGVRRIYGMLLGDGDFRLIQRARDIKQTMMYGHTLPTLKDMGCNIDFTDVKANHNFLMSVGMPDPDGVMSKDPQKMEFFVNTLFQGRFQVTRSMDFENDHGDFQYLDDNGNVISIPSYHQSLDNSDYLYKSDQINYGHEKGSGGGQNAVSAVVNAGGNVNIGPSNLTGNYGITNQIKYVPPVGMNEITNLKDLGDVMSYSRANKPIGDLVSNNTIKKYGLNPDTSLTDLFDEYFSDTKSLPLNIKLQPDGVDAKDLDPIAQKLLAKGYDSNFNINGFHDKNMQSLYAFHVSDVLAREAKCPYIASNKLYTREGLYQGLIQQRHDGDVFESNWGVANECFHDGASQMAEISLSNFDRLVKNLDIDNLKITVPSTKKQNVFETTPINDLFKVNTRKSTLLQDLIDDNYYDNVHGSSVGIYSAGKSFTESEYFHCLFKALKDGDNDNINKNINKLCDAYKIKNPNPNPTDSSFWNGLSLVSFVNKYPDIIHEFFNNINQGYLDIISGKENFAGMVEYALQDTMNDFNYFITSFENLYNENSKTFYSAKQRGGDLISKEVVKELENVLNDGDNVDVIKKAFLIAAKKNKMNADFRLKRDVDLYKRYTHGMNVSNSVEKYKTTFNRFAKVVLPTIFGAGAGIAGIAGISYINNKPHIDPEERKKYYDNQFNILYDATESSFSNESIKSLTTKTDNDNYYRFYSYNHNLFSAIKYNNDAKSNYFDRRDEYISSELSKYHKVSGLSNFNSEVSSFYNNLDKIYYRYKNKKRISNAMNKNNNTVEPNNLLNDNHNIDDEEKIFRLVVLSKDEWEPFMSQKEHNLLMFEYNRALSSFVNSNINK